MLVRGQCCGLPGPRLRYPLCLDGLGPKRVLFFSDVLLLIFVSPLWWDRDTRGYLLPGVTTDCQCRRFIYSRSFCHDYRIVEVERLSRYDGVVSVDNCESG